MGKSNEKPEKKPARKYVMRGKKQDESKALRRYTFRLYPTPRQEARLRDIKGLHQRLYNGALEERIEAYRRAGKTLSIVDQCKELTLVRKDDPGGYGALNCHASQTTLWKLDQAFKAFFRRLKAKKGRAGFPRFKSYDRFNGWSYRTNIFGWKFYHEHGTKRGRLELQELRKERLGLVRAKGRTRVSGTPKSLSVMHKSGKWFASVVFECELADLRKLRSHGEEELGFDWGIELFITLSNGEKIENPGWRAQCEKEIARLQRVVSRRKLRSGRRKRAIMALARLRAKIAARRKDFHHQTANELVARARVLATEKLTTKNLTRSAKGTVESPGRNVRQKAGLNRSILDGAPASFLQIIRYKAVEARTRFEEIKTQKVKPSQTCPQCGKQEKKKLSKRWHSCECGCEMHRNHAAALVCIKEVLGRDPRGPGDSGSVAVEEARGSPDEAAIPDRLEQIGLFDAA